jgi:hypothetical protein
VCLTTRLLDVDREVRILGPKCVRVAAQRIGDHCRAGFDRCGDEAPQAVSRGVGDHSQSDPPEPPFAFRGTFDRHCHQGLSLRTTATLALSRTSDDGLVDFDLSAEQLTSRRNHRTPQPVQHRPRGLVAAEPEHPLQTQGACTLLLRRHEPSCLEPDGEGRTGPVEDRPGRRAHPSTAASTRSTAVGQHPRRRFPAARAHEPVGPAEPVQVVQAGRVCREPRTQVRKLCGVMHPGRWTFEHPITVLHSHG